MYKNNRPVNMELIATACELMSKAPVGEAISYMTHRGVMHIMKMSADNFSITGTKDITSGESDYAGLGLAILHHAY